MPTDLDLTIYSEYPIDLPPAETDAAICLWKPPTPPLVKTPWRLDDSLIGTIWRNVHTGRELIIAGVCPNNYGELNAFPDMTNLRFSLGLGIWRRDRYPDGVLTYRVEHWVRIDHRTPREQFDWMMWEVNRTERERDRMLNEAKTYKACGDTGNANSHIDMYQHQSDRARIARDAAAAFARKHSLAITTEDINQNRIGQLVLF